MTTKNALVIAGPNGAGKTTFARELMLRAIDDHVQRRVSFAFETTLAGRGYARSIPRWRGLGYQVEIMFLALPSPEAAIARVAERVRQGGHFIPDDVVRRRYASGWSNFQEIYRPLVDYWAVYDNSGDVPALIDWGANR